MDDRRFLSSCKVPRCRGRRVVPFEEFGIVFSRVMRRHRRSISANRRIIARVAVSLRHAGNLESSKRRAIINWAVPAKKAAVVSLASVE